MRAKPQLLAVYGPAFSSRRQGRTLGDWASKARGFQRTHLEIIRAAIASRPFGHEQAALGTVDHPQARRVRLIRSLARRTRVGSLVLPTCKNTVTKATPSSTPFGKRAYAPTEEGGSIVLIGLATGETSLTTLAHDRLKTRTELVATLASQLTDIDHEVWE